MSCTPYNLHTYLQSDCYVKRLRVCTNKVTPIGEKKKKTNKLYRVQSTATESELLTLSLSKNKKNNF